MTKQELSAAVEIMIGAPSCCGELRDAGRKYLDAVGTSGEKAAFDALLAEIKDDVCTLDETIPFFESERGAQIFGAEKARAMAAHARELKARGEKWCDCAACASGVKILACAAGK
ncbi:MAG: heat-shock protein Hsp90 [Lentisphaeria bacterium]|nr:heat-shock protein Hsp90 [Lentisphaeria bacterium]